ncbi:MAG: hypothetical protein MJE63_11370 [Proteobacteria bacterium]|nr:hypothetical protein [Pseudomonadota bacterium]
MLKKLLTGCLTIAMIGAFSASAVAETTFTWKGNVAATLEQSTTKAATDGAESITEMDMYATGDLDLVVEKSGDTWTGTAYLDIDFKSNDDAIPEAQKLGIDDAYVKMSNDTMAISFGEFDPVGIGKGWDNLGDNIDETYGAGGNGNQVPNEQGWLMLSLTEVGLNLFIGMNQDSVDFNEDATNDDGEAASTSFGASFDKSFGDLSLALEYVSKSWTRDENNGDAIGEDSLSDGASTAGIALAVQYSLGNMAFALNYESATLTYGGDADDDLKESWMELVFDMAISDTQGLSAGYGMKTQELGDTKYAGTDLTLSFKLGTGGVDHYFTYWSATWKEEDADESKDDSKIGYTMQVGF